MIPIFYRPDFVVGGAVGASLRKAQWVAESLSRAPISGLRLVEPDRLDITPFNAIHDPAYVQAVISGEPRDLAESAGFGWDAAVWPMAQAINGGVVAAALAALETGVAGSLSSGLHHARYASGAGYCLFNGLVIAARAALDAGARSVLILDVDAHCGGGTASLIVDEPRLFQLDLAVDAYDRYAEHARARLCLVRQAGEYLPTLTRMLDDLDAQGRSFDLCLYNAGMDPSEDSALGGLAGLTRAILAERERRVFDWCRVRGLPIAFVLAGGYLGARLDVAGLVDLHRLTLAAAGQSVGCA